MKLALVFFIVFISLNSASAAEIKCFDDNIDFEYIRQNHIDVLEVLYSKVAHLDYQGRLCGVEDTQNLCFSGDVRDAALLLEGYFKYVYQYDDEVNGFFAKGIQTRLSDRIRLHYREQWNSYVTDITRCEN